MGLAPYGDPGRHYDALSRLITLRRNGTFRIDLSFFNYHLERTKNRCSEKFAETFGAGRRKGEDLSENHKDIAAALQLVTEETILHMAKVARAETGSPNLCLSGGVALNSVSNGRILREGIFDDVFIQPAASDGGCAVGACFTVYNVLLGHPRAYVLKDAYTGKGYTEEEMLEALRDTPGITYERVEDVASHAARLVAEGKIVGWFQGRAEFGPRALGNRSILADPRLPEMKDILNHRVKHREPFRPFAPSVLAEKCAEYFETGYPSPYMLLVYKVRPAKRQQIPAVTHVDDTGRVQTVDRDTNPLYWDLIKAFEERTGVPVVLNTSFNIRGMPIVNSPRDALDCFVGTGMDHAVIGPYVASKTP
jgi:carbamoyltransferase